MKNRRKTTNALSGIEALESRTMLTAEMIDSTPIDLSLDDSRQAEYALLQESSVDTLPQQEHLIHQFTMDDEARQQLFQQPGDLEATTDDDGRPAVILGKTSTEHLNLKEQLDLSGSLTVSADVMLDGSKGIHTLVSQYSTNGQGKSFLFQIRNDIDKLYLYTSNGHHQVDYAFPVNTWANVAFTYDTNTGDITFFVDGTAVGTSKDAPNAIRPSNASSAVGHWQANHDKLGGAIADINIWDTALSSEEVHTASTVTPPQEVAELEAAVAGIDDDLLTEIATAIAVQEHDGQPQDIESMTDHWRSVTNPRFAYSDIRMEGDTATTTGHAFLSSHEQHNPAEQPIEVTGTFNMLPAPKDDAVFIGTRAMGIPEGQNRTIINGIRTLIHTNGTIRIDEASNNHWQQLAQSNYAVQRGTPYNFSVVDDGTTVTLTLYDAEGTELHSISGQSERPFATNHVVLANGELDRSRTTFSDVTVSDYNPQPELVTSSLQAQEAVEEGPAPYAKMHVEQGGDHPNVYGVKFASPHNQTFFEVDDEEPGVKSHLVEHPGGTSLSQVHFPIHTSGRVRISMYEDATKQVLLDSFEGHQTGGEVYGETNGNWHNWEEGRKLEHPHTPTISIVKQDGPNLIVAFQSPYDSSTIILDGGGYFNEEVVEHAGGTELSMHRLTFNTDNPERGYHVRLREGRNNREVAVCAFYWDPASKSFTLQTHEEPIAALANPDNQETINAMKHDLSLQMAVDHIGWGDPTLRNVQRSQLFDYSLYKFYEGDDDYYAQNSSLSSHPDIGSMVKQAMGYYSDAIGDLLVSAANVAINAHMGRSQQEAVDRFYEHHTVASTLPKVIEFSSLTRIPFPDAPTLLQEGLRLAKEKPEFFYEKMEKNESLIARARHAALNSAGPNTPPERSQAAIERQLQSIREAHGGDAIAYQQAVDSYYAALDGNGQNASTVIASDDNNTQVGSEEAVIVSSTEVAMAPFDVEAFRDVMQSLTTEINEDVTFSEEHLLAARASLLAYGEPLEDIPLENQNVYEFHNLNASAIVGNAELDGEHVLVIAFRGTDTPDFSELVQGFQEWATEQNITVPAITTAELMQNEHFQQFLNEVPNSAADFLTDAINIDAHYNSFINFEEWVFDLVDRKSIDRVLVTGHSLGGAMAQMLMKRTGGDSSYRAITFGSPGTTISNVERNDDRITNIAHEHDIAVLLGWLRGYRRSGNEIETSFPFSPVSAHSMANYLETIEQNLVDSSNL